MQAQLEHYTCRRCRYYRPDVPMLSYLAYYHTLFWVVCKHPTERHIPILNRLLFLFLSLGFNMCAGRGICGAVVRAPLVVTQFIAVSKVRGHHLYRNGLLARQHSLPHT